VDHAGRGDSIPLNFSDPWTTARRRCSESSWRSGLDVAREHVVLVPGRKELVAHPPQKVNASRSPSARGGLEPLSSERAQVLVPTWCRRATSSVVDVAQPPGRLLHFCSPCRAIRRTCGSAGALGRGVSRTAKVLLETFSASTFRTVEQRGRRPPEARLLHRGAACGWAFGRAISRSVGSRLTAWPDCRPGPRAHR